MNNIKKILIVNDLTCMGKCSSMINIPILTTLNIEVYLLPTALLSNHNYGFKSSFIKDLNDEIENIIYHWNINNIKFDAIFIGCIIKPLKIHIINKILKNFSHNKTFVLIDPIIGDNGHLYKIYDNKHIKYVEELCYNAKIITPNITEACFLTNTKYIHQEKHNNEYINNILFKLYSKYNSIILLTGIKLIKDKITIAIYNKNKITLINDTYIDQYYPGTGDIFCSILLGMILNENSIYKSCKIAMKFIIKSILETKKLNRDNKYGIYFENNLYTLNYFIKKR